MNDKKLPREQAKAGRCQSRQGEARCWRWDGHSGPHRGSSRFYTGHRIEWPNNVEMLQRALASADCVTADLNAAFELTGTGKR